MIGMTTFVTLVLGAAPCGDRYGCVDHPPAWYDQLVEVAEAPGDETDVACLERLKATHIEHRLLRGVRGVTTPVEVLDETVGNVRYVPTDPERRRLILDCHMVEALAARGRAMQRAGVSTIHWSSSWRYSYRRGTETLSAHAHGRALDVVAIEGDFGYATVRGHYERGVEGCGEANRDARSAAFRGLVCALNDAFGTIYTPDTDDNHRDHLHVEDPDPEIRHLPRARVQPALPWWRRPWTLATGVLLLLGLALWWWRKRSPGE